MGYIMLSNNAPNHLASTDMRGPPCSLRGSVRVPFECNNRSGHEKPQSVGVPAETLTKDLQNTSLKCLGRFAGD
jgi:hypothetical protein